MFRWENIETQDHFGMDVKMYRPTYEASEVQIVNNEYLALDHLAYTYLGDSAYMYKILDLNFIDYMENRGDVSKMGAITIPVKDRLE